MVEETVDDTVVVDATRTEPGEATGAEEPGTAPVAAALIPTPAQAVGAVRYAAVLLFLLGGVALLVGALVAQLGRRKAPAP